MDTCALRMCLLKEKGKKNEDMFQLRRVLDPSCKLLFRRSPRTLSYTHHIFAGYPVLRSQRSLRFLAAIQSLGQGGKSMQ
jgi:hypothetical protein